MNAIAAELNNTIKASNPHIYDMLSDMGKALYFPKGILSQSAEAKVKAHKINATIGIAKEGNSVLSLSSITRYIKDIEPDAYLPYAPSFGIPALREKWKKVYIPKTLPLETRPSAFPWLPLESPTGSVYCPICGWTKGM